MQIKKYTKRMIVKTNTILCIPLIKMIKKSEKTKIEKIEKNKNVKFIACIGDSV